MPSSPIQSAKLWLKRLKLRDLLIIIYLAALFFTNVYRAATQSITHDEALTYLWFAQYPWKYLFSVFDANHHVLNTILVKISISLFGLSELTMRLPSLLGGVLYLTSVYRLCNLVFKRSFYLLLAIGLLTLNPFILDFLVAARGYGLALGFLIWSIYHIVEFLSGSATSGSKWHILKASLGLALSVSANLAFVYVCAAVALMFGLLFLLQPSPKQNLARRLVVLILGFVFPGAVTATLINIGPVSHATSDNFYAGSATLSQSVKSILYYSLCHGFSDRVGLLCEPYNQHQTAGVVFTLIIAALIAAITVFTIVVRRLRSSASLSHLIFLNGSFLTCLAVIVAAHLTFGVLYPRDRTGLFLLPLFAICFCLTAEYLHDFRKKSALLLAPVHLVLLLALVQHAIQFNLEYFAIWRYDTADKQMFLVLLQQKPERAPIRVGVNGLFLPSIDFYRAMYQTDGLETSDDIGPTSSADYYMLYENDADRLKNAGKILKLEYQNDTSNSRSYRVIR
jgi:hypothetical protein